MFGKLCIATMMVFGIALCFNMMAMTMVDGCLVQVIERHWINRLDMWCRQLLRTCALNDARLIRSDTSVDYNEFQLSHI